MTHPNVVNIKTERIKGHPHKLWVPVGRGTPWGNRFVVGVHGDRTTCISRHEAWVRSQPALVARIKAQLKGKVLGCYCAPLPCHGDTLATIAEET